MPGAVGPVGSSQAARACDGGNGELVGSFHAGKVRRGGNGVRVSSEDGWGELGASR